MVVVEVDWSAKFSFGVKKRFSKENESIYLGIYAESLMPSTEEVGLRGGTKMSKAKGILIHIYERLAEMFMRKPLRLELVGVQCLWGMEIDMENSQQR